MKITECTTVPGIRDVVRFELDGRSVEIYAKHFRELVFGRSWRIIGGYVATNSCSGNTTEYLARLITKAKPGERVIFVNGDRLDLKRTNLEIVVAAKAKRNYS